MCVTGGQNLLQAWDIRTPDVPVRQYQYKDDFGQVMKNLLFVLTFCLLGKFFHAFLSSADFFSKSTLSKNYLRNTIRVSNSLNTNQV